MAGLEVTTEVRFEATSPELLDSYRREVEAAVAEARRA